MMQFRLDINIYIQGVQNCKQNTQARTYTCVARVKPFLEARACTCNIVHTNMG